jgi:hypothetical protein
VSESTGLSREEKRALLRGLETLRGRLAVAVAAERKRITFGRWEDYLRTEERARGLLRSLRGTGVACRGRPLDEILHRLRSLPAPRAPNDRESEARRLGGCMAEILDLLESLIGQSPDGESPICAGALVTEPEAASSSDSGGSSTP